ncbi:hypothetical protein BCV00_16850 [Vibrio breoganii]|uniref:hypothetical protein n=1 Tax=Vibrio breoganii TaxID=553239 RepID=UPI000C82C999|nr:hypothetical protein [Vibrio breoganii]PMG02855.1 hypothetical protein BCV00_16850 [Vibrio breoganii]
MEVSKTALAVALSTGLLFGCDFDVGPDSDSDTGTNPTTPTSDLVGPYWNFDASAASTQSTDLPNIYVFDGENQKYYTDNADDTVLGTYVILTETYSEEDGVVTFTYYDAEGNPIKATGQFEVVDGNITIDTDTVGVLNGTDDQTAEVKAAVEAANAEAGFNNLVQIQDTLNKVNAAPDGETGELRLKFADSATDMAVSEITKGKLTVDLVYQIDEDTEQEADGTGDNAYVSFYASKESNSNLHGEVAFENGKIKYRDASGSLTETGDTFELGEKLEVEVTWDTDTFSFSVNDFSYGPFAVADGTAVQTISLKIGDNGNTTNFELLGDNLAVYNITGADEELVFEDNFDSYAVGTNLKENPYNKSTSEAIVVSATGDSAPGEDETDPGDGEENPGDGDTDPGDGEPVVGDTITKLNERIRALPALDDDDYDSGNVGTVTVFADGVYENGIIVIDRPVNLVGEDGATIDSSCTVIQRYETDDEGNKVEYQDVENTVKSTKIRNVSIENITFTGAAAESCSVNESGSTAKSAIYLAGDTGGQINFSNLSFEPDTDGNAPDNAWFYARGQFELSNSVFSGLDDTSGIQVNAGSSAGRKGSLIHDNSFERALTITGITSGVQIGHKTVDSAGLVLDVANKDGALGHQANVYVYGNEFSNFDLDITADITSTDNGAVFANDASDAALVIHEDVSEVAIESNNVISDAAILADGQGYSYNTFN